MIMSKNYVNVCFGNLITITSKITVHELFTRAFQNKCSMWIVLVFPRKTSRIHKNGRNSRTFPRFAPFFGLVCRADSWITSELFPNMQCNYLCYKGIIPRAQRGLCAPGFRSNRKAGTASLRSHTCIKRNAVFGARFKGLSQCFLYRKGNLIRSKTGLDTYLIRIQARTPLSRCPPYDYSKASMLKIRRLTAKCRSKASEICTHTHTWPYMTWKGRGRASESLPDGGGETQCDTQALHDFLDTVVSEVSKRGWWEGVGD